MQVNTHNSYEWYSLLFPISEENEIDETVASNQLKSESKAQEWPNIDFGD